MSYQRTIRMALATLIAVCLMGVAVTSAAGLPSAAPTADRALVERAIEDLEAAQLEAARIDFRMREASAELDRILAEQQRAQKRLSSRVRIMYLSNGTSLVSVLLGAESFQDLVTRWDLLMRMSQQDAADLDTLRAARADAERSAQSLMRYQAEQARAVDEAAREVASAREELAASEAALEAYEARLAEQAPPAPAVTPSDSTPQVSGSGDWQTGVASHYGRTFTGRGASGEAIGPYSMMVAHRTLPFGTLVEFEYDGKLAVASVEDRGPHVEGRMWDLGPGVVRVLDFSGVHEVRYRVIGQ